MLAPRRHTIIHLNLNNSFLKENIFLAISLKVSCRAINRYQSFKEIIINWTIMNYGYIFFLGDTESVMFDVIKIRVNISFLWVSFPISPLILPFKAAIYDVTHDTFRTCFFVLSWIVVQIRIYQFYKSFTTKLR